MRVRRSTMLLVPLLCITVVLWIVSHIADFGVDYRISETRLISVSYERGTMCLRIFTSRFSRPGPYFAATWRPMEGAPCDDDQLPGVGFTNFATVKRLHIHHWLVTLLISVTMVTLHLRRRYRFRRGGLAA